MILRKRAFDNKREPEMTSRTVPSGSSAVMDSWWKYRVASVLALSLGCAMGAPSRLPTSGDNPAVAFVGATIIDGNGSAVSNGVLLIRDGKVVCANEKIRCSIPTEA